MAHSRTTARFSAPARQPRLARGSGLLAVFLTAHDRWRGRRRLERMPAERLYDLGLDDFDLRRECAKPFWRR